MELVQASDEDLQKVSQLTGQAMAEGTLGEFNGENEKANSMMAKVLAKNGILLVANESDQIAGWILFGTQKDSITDQLVGYIYELYVLESYRKKGYGKKLMEECTRRLKNQGINDIRLVVYKGNTAIKLYEQLGFTETRIVMTKKL